MFGAREFLRPCTMDRLLLKTDKSTGRICWHNILENKMESIDRMGSNHLVDARDVTNKAIWMALNNFTDKEIEEKSELIYQAGLHGLWLRSIG